MASIDRDSTPAEHLVKPPRQAYLALLVGVLAVSTGAIFVRFAQQEAPSLSIAAYRMGIAFLVVLIPNALWYPREFRALSRRDVMLATTSGLFLAIHFAAWIYSLELTSVAISVVMVNTAPLWIGVLSPMITGEWPTRATILSIVLSVAGVVVMASSIDRGETASSDFVGGLLATLGALGLAVYLLIGRLFQSRRPLGVYVTLCYGAAAGFLFVAAWGAQQQLVGFSSFTWSCLFGLALVSQIMGHTVNNWALRFFTASAIGVVLLGEPVISAMLAYFLFNETLSIVHGVGGVLILLGIYLAATAGQPPLQQDSHDP